MFRVEVVGLIAVDYAAVKCEIGRERDERDLQISVIFYRCLLKPRHGGMCVQTHFLPARRVIRVAALSFESG